MMSSHFQEVILFTTSTKPTQQCRRIVTTGSPRLMQVQEKSRLGKLYCTRSCNMIVLDKDPLYVILENQKYLTKNLCH